MDKYLRFDFRKYGPDKPDIGDLCICECVGFCEEGAVIAKYTKNGFYFSPHGAILDTYITGFVVLDI